ncbi:hypothetical protein RF11_06944 [Thelohanellus kitauei]|uniref:Tetraspanin n=1 Tax=Thelohanellus kitauei TaxID=669202 RepID=A0A0C2M4F8_THEKT|nr:hypothetical protein RF11_06944 [Thelohanellus kitauei]
MLIGFTVLLSLTVFLLVSVGSTAVTLFLKMYGADFCGEIENLHVLTALIGFGCVVTFLQVIGFAGTLGNSRCLQYLYTVFCMLLMMGCSLITIFLVLRWDQAKPVLSRCINFDISLRHKWNDGFVNRFQKKHHCCGLTSIHNWGFIAYPPSCCTHSPSLCIYPNQKPCAPFLAGNEQWLGIFVVGSLFTVVFLSPFVYIGMLFLRKERDYSLIAEQD